MSFEKAKQSIERNDKQKTVDFALDAKSESARVYTEIIDSLDERFKGYEFAKNILKRYIKNEITKAASENGFASVASTLKKNAEKYGKFFDYMRSNLKNNDFAKKLGLRSASVDPDKIVPTAVRDGGVTGAHKAIVKYFAIMRFMQMPDPIDQNVYVTDTYEEEIKEVPLPTLLAKFAELVPGVI